MGQLSALPKPRANSTGITPAVNAGEDNYEVLKQTIPYQSSITHQVELCRPTKEDW